MDDANRVPIDIGYEVAAAAATDQRTVVKEDGTVVIDYVRSVMVWKRADAPNRALFPEPRDEGSGSHAET